MICDICKKECKNYKDWMGEGVEGNHCVGCNIFVCWECGKDWTDTYERNLDLQYVDYQHLNNYIDDYIDSDVFNGGMCAKCSSYVEKYCVELKPVCKDLENTINNIYIKWKKECQKK